MESMIIFSAKEIGRVTYSNQNILDIVAEELPDMSIGKITDVMTYYIAVLRRTLAKGYVKI